MNIHRELNEFEKYLRRISNDEIVVREIRNNLNNLYFMNRDKEFIRGLKLGSLLTGALLADGLIEKEQRLEKIIILSIIGGASYIAGSFIKQTTQNALLKKKIRYVVNSTRAFHHSIEEFLVYYEELIKNNFKVYDNEDLKRIKRKISNSYYNDINKHIYH